MKTLVVIDFNNVLLLLSTNFIVYYLYLFIHIY